METANSLRMLKKTTGKPLIEIPQLVSTIGFVNDYFDGKEFVNEFNGRTLSDYDNAGALRVLSYTNGIVKGSNPFAVVLANQIAEQAGLRVAKQSDLEKAMNLGAMNFAGTYEDTGLVVRSEEDKDRKENTYLAQNLTNQIRARLGKKSKLPVMLPLVGLRLVKDTNSQYGLAFELKENAEIIYAPILSKEGSFSSEDINAETGLPNKLTGGNRNLYTRSSGLSGLVLGRGFGLYSRYEVLASSYENGRVVFVSGEASAQKISK